MVIMEKMHLYAYAWELVFMQLIWQVIGVAGTHGRRAASPVGVVSVRGPDCVRGVIRTAVFALMESSSRLRSATNSLAMVIAWSHACSLN
jgi:hypothetical protein